MLHDDKGKEKPEKENIKTSAHLDPSSFQGILMNGVVEKRSRELTATLWTLAQGPFRTGKIIMEPD